MQWALLFYELAFFLFFLCYGAPPDKSGRYTREEEEFVVNKLESHANLFNRCMWKNIAEAHAKKVRDKAPGFPMKRSDKALRKHISRLIRRNDIRVSDKVKLLRDDKINKPYHREEEAFINKELLSHDGSLASDDLWIKMKRRHDRRRGSGDLAFSNKRTAIALRNHFMRSMVRHNRVDEAVKQRFEDFFKNRRDSIEESNQSELCPNEIVFRYSYQENDLLIKMLETHADVYNQHDTWKVIERAHKNNVEANVPGFPIPRSARALYQHFTDVIRYTDIEVPDAVRLLYEKYTNTYYDVREQDFINAKLQTFYTSKLSNRKMWEDIERQHDEKRISGCPGFQKKRTWSGLRSYFQKRMVPSGLVDEAVKERFPSYFRNKLGSTSIEEKRKSENDSSEYTQGLSDDETELWSTILGELTPTQGRSVDEYGVDHTLFLGRKSDVEYDFFEPFSPHELRTFDPISPQEYLLP